MTSKESRGLVLDLLGFRQGAASREIVESEGGAALWIDREDLDRVAEALNAKGTTTDLARTASEALTTRGARLARVPSGLLFAQEHLHVYYWYRLNDVLVALYYLEEAARRDLARGFGLTGASGTDLHSYREGCRALRLFLAAYREPGGLDERPFSDMYRVLALAETLMRDKAKAFVGLHSEFQNVKNYAEKAGYVAATLVAWWNASRPVPFT